MMIRRWLLAVLAFLPVALAQGAEPKTDEDFAFQGEYVGDAPKPDGSKVKFGIQVIALGKGKFEAVGYPGGLPGDGWIKEAGTKKATGELKDGVVTLTDKGFTATIKDGVLTGSDEAGGLKATLKKVERKSPTLGMKPPAGAVVLFDGTDGSKFNNGKGKVEDGLLVPRADSDLKYQDCTLHVEFRTPYMPEARGQARGNSGVYLQGRYECQVLDSFGLKGENNECGGIYGIKTPDVNMCFPPLSWQTYDIDYTAAKFDAAGKKTTTARITVKHNGVLIHDNAELPKGTTAAPVKEGPEPGPLHLQDHGNPVRFRNIWIVEKK